MAKLFGPPPPTDDQRLNDFLLEVYRRTQGINTAAGSNTTDHATLSNLNSTNYSHLTSAQLTGLTAGGDTALHFHSSDRNRANHTGTQPSSTISDFDAAVAASVVNNSGSISTDIIKASVFGS